LYETSNIRSIAQVIQVSSDTFEIPIDADDVEDGGWVSELADRPETPTSRVGLQKIEIHEQYAQPRLTQKVLDDAAIQIDLWLSNKIADRLSRKENTAFVTGDGTGKPKGFLAYGPTAVTTSDKDGRPWGKLQYFATGSATGFPVVSGAHGTYDNPD